MADRHLWARAARSQWAVATSLVMLTLSGAPGPKSVFADDPWVTSPPTPRSSGVLTEILSLPPPDVVPALVRAIRSHPAFQEPNLRHQAYSLLLRLDGVQDAAGVRQFITGLGDPVVSCQCIYALGSAPDRYREDVVAALKTYLGWLIEGRTLPCYDTTALFDAITRQGQSATALAGRLERIALDTLAPVSLRGHAARALVEVSGIVHHSKITKSALAHDSLGAKLLINALLLQGELNRWSFVNGPQTRQALIDLLAALLQVQQPRGSDEYAEGADLSEQLRATGEVLSDRIDIGGLLVESITRARPAHARLIMVSWIEALGPLAHSDPRMFIRLKATTRIYEAQKRLTYLVQY